MCRLVNCGATNRPKTPPPLDKTPTHPPSVHQLQLHNLGTLGSLLLLEVLVGAVADQTADEEDGVQADAEAGRVVVGSRGDGTGDGSLGLGVAGLQRHVSDQLDFL